MAAAGHGVPRPPAGLLADDADETGQTPGRQTRVSSDPRGPPAPSCWPVDLDVDAAFGIERILVAAGSVLPAVDAKRGSRRLAFLRLPHP